MFLILISVFGKRYSVQFEVQRKLIHMVLGFISLSFPFLFHTPLEVELVVLASFGGLISLNYVPWLRRTLGGEYLWGSTILAGRWCVYNCGWIAVLRGSGNYALFAGPLVVVTFADAFAAIVGTRCGKKHYGILGAYKSVEGTVAFLVTAFVSTFLVVCLTTDHLVMGALLISVVVAVASTVAELFSGRDLDNPT